MNPPPEARGLSLTLSYGSGGERRVRRLPLGAALRVAAALSLCAGCFEVGRWAGRLEEPAAPRPASSVVVVEKLAGKVLPEVVGIAPGGANGDKDVITPLNVRDPSALVMGPSEPAPPRAAAEPAPEGVPEINPPAKVYKKIKDIKPNRRF